MSFSDRSRALPPIVKIRRQGCASAQSAALGEFFLAPVALAFDSGLMIFLQLLFVQNFSGQLLKEFGGIPAMVEDAKFRSLLTGAQTDAMGRFFDKTAGEQNTAFSRHQHTRALGPSLVVYAHKNPAIGVVKFRFAGGKTVFKKAFEVGAVRPGQGAMSMRAPLNRRSVVLGIEIGRDLGRIPGCQMRAQRSA